VSRIVFFVSSMQGGGAERVAALLCTRWVERGHDVLLVPTYSGRGECLYPMDERVCLEYLADRVGTTRKTLSSTARRLLAMRALVREFGTDAVLSFLPHVNVVALLATRGLNLPVVVAERVYPPAMDVGPVWSRLRHLAYPWASRVIVQTRPGLDWLASASPRSAGAVIPNPSVCPLPIGEPRIDPGTVISDESRLLLAVGRLEKQKGFDRLIRAFERLVPRLPDWDLVILGEGSERPALESRIAACRLSARVHLPGRVGNLGDWYARADLYVMSSRFEGFPNTLMEAMAHGVPAVSFDCDTGPAELIEDGVNGYLVAPGAGAAGLAERLGALMADATTRRTLGERAAEVRQRYSLERVGAKWDQVLGLEG